MTLFGRLYRYLSSLLIASKILDSQIICFHLMTIHPVVPRILLNLYIDVVFRTKNSFKYS